ncbi:MAG: NAD(P)-dependent oxidoreductase [Bacteroidia bacterium]|nr:NAD(P)-dependent oxidoreductase [Bacteroidia bacterium]
MPISVLLTESYHPLLIETLRRDSRLQLNHVEKPTFEEILPFLKEAEVWIMRGAVPVTEKLLEAAMRLRLIIRAGSGIEHIDKEALRRRGIELRHTPQANATPVAEYVLAALLVLARRLLPAHHALRESDKWLRRESIGRELSELTVGIIGFGQNGSRTAHLLAALGARVLAYDKYKGGFGGLGVREVSLEEMYEEVDVLSLHVPLTPETQRLVNQDFLACFHRPIALINPARGGVVDLVAVADALDTGRLWGLAMDTLPAEPPVLLSPRDREAWERIRRHPVAFLTPHIAGLTGQSELRLARAVLRLLQSWLER